MSLDAHLSIISPHLGGRANFTEEGNDACLPRSAAACKLPVVLAVAPAPGLTAVKSALRRCVLPERRLLLIAGITPRWRAGEYAKATWVTGYRDYVEEMSRPHL